MRAKTGALAGLLLVVSGLSACQHAPSPTRSTTPVAAPRSPAALDAADLRLDRSDRSSRASPVVLLPPPSAPKPKPFRPRVSGGGTATFYQLDALSDCESGRNPNEDTGNGFVNAFQYVRSTWDSLVKKIGRPDLVGRYWPDYETQRRVTQHIPISTWGDQPGRRGQFPGCYVKLHQRGIV